MFNIKFCPYCGKSLERLSKLTKPVIEKIKYFSPSDLDSKEEMVEIETYLGCIHCGKELQNNIISVPGGNTYWSGK